MDGHGHTGGTYLEVTRELALRSRQRVAFAELEQPAYLTDTLGPVPESVRGRRAWRQAARAVQEYRQHFQIDDPDRPLGEPPARGHDDPERQQAWRAASGAIQRMQARQQRTRELDRDPTPGSVRSIPNHGESSSRHAATRDPDPVQGPERAAG
jgi:hypothetical protein